MKSLKGLVGLKRLISLIGLNKIERVKLRIEHLEKAHRIKHHISETKKCSTPHHINHMSLPAYFQSW